MPLVTRWLLVDSRGSRNDRRDGGLADPDRADLGDSTTVMAVPLPASARDSMLAASQPAVPPPTIATCRMFVRRRG